MAADSTRLQVKQKEPAGPHGPHNLDEQPLSRMYYFDHTTILPAVFWAGAGSQTANSDLHLPTFVDTTPDLKYFSVLQESTVRLLGPVSVLTFIQIRSNSLENSEATAAFQIEKLTPNNYIGELLAYVLIFLSGLCESHLFGNQN